MSQDVNSQIIDSVNSTMAHVVGHSSAESQGLLDTLMAETVGMAMYNAVTSQHNSQMVSTASITAACARMLKIPLAISPAVPIAQPLITGVTSTVAGVAPGTIPISATDQTLQMAGQNFPPNPTIMIFDAKFNKLAVLNGSTQITTATVTSCTFVTSAFATEGTYNVVIGSGTQGSLPFQLQAEAPAPMVGAAQMQNGKLQLKGSHFQPGMIISLLNERKEQLPEKEAENLTPSTAETALPEGQGAGAYEIQARNPDGRTSAPMLFVVPPSPSVPVNLALTPSPVQAHAMAANPCDPAPNPCQPAPNPCDPEPTT